MKPQERRREKKMNSCFFVDEEKSHVLLKDLVCGKVFLSGREERPGRMIPSDERSGRICVVGMEKTETFV
jgi:hypothetical protein